jgi:TPR repeat protein
MRSLTATLCLTLAVLLGSAGVSVSQDFQVGLDAARKGDYATALREWTPLAEQGDAGAQYNLGLMYGNGDGVPQDDKNAMKWYTLAAEQGHASAQTSLGVVYANGYGVQQDYVYAHMWFNIAASSGEQNAPENRDLVAERMTPSQIERAQDLARECVAKNYKGC